MSDSISPDDIDGVGPKGFFRSVALKQVEPNSSGDVRLLQQAPAWGLHLLLRANGIKYTTENVLFPFAIGHRLPVLIRGNVFYTEGAVLLSNASLVDEIQVDKDAMIASYISSIRDLSVAIAEIDDQGQRRQCGVVRALGSRMLEWYHDGVGGARYTRRIGSYLLVSGFNACIFIIGTCPHSIRVGQKRELFITSHRCTRI